MFDTGLKKLHVQKFMGNRLVSYLSEDGFRVSFAHV